MRTVVLSILAACVLPGQTVLNLSQDLVRLRIAPSNMVPNSPGLDSGPPFFLGVSYAQSHGIPRVIADPGTYYFPSLQWSGAHVAWDRLHDLTIDLQGSDLYFSHPLVDGILITRSVNIVLQNFTVDYDPLPFTQVRVVSVDAALRRIRFAVDGAWQNPTVLNQVFSVASAGAGSVEVHLFRNGRPIPGVPRMYAVNPLGSGQFGILDQGGKPAVAAVALIRPGDIAFLGMRTGAAGPVSAAYCTGCTFRNITAYSSVEWGLANLGSQSSVYERTYSIPRPGTDRLASTYGQPELGAAGPGNQVRLNRMIRTMDNGIPMAADSLGTVKSQTDSRTLVVEGALSTWLQLGGAVPDGSAVMFQRPSDGSLLGTARIVSQNAPPFTGQDPYSVTYTFDRDLPAAVVGSVMQGLDPSQRAANTVIERNALEEETDCCRGFLLGGMVDSVVRGNYIQGAPMAALHIENALYHDFLSPPVENFTISNNVIDHTNWTATGFPYYQLGAIEVVTAKSNVAPAAAGAHQNVAVSGNFIADSGTPAVWMGNTSGGSVSGNYFLTPNNNPAVTATVAAIGATQPVVLAGSANVAAAGNTVDQTSGRVWITDASYRKLAAYAPGGVVRLNAYEIGTLGTPSVTLTDADGRTAPAPVQSSSAHSIDVLVPATAALGGAYLTLAAGGLKYFGTLFVDDRDNVPALNGCTYDLSPAATSVGAAAGNLAVLVVTQADCAYNVTAAGGFARAGAGGAGTGVVSVALSSNSGADRVVAIEVAGQQFSATQTAPSGARPVVKSIYDAWNYTAGIAPGAWVTLTGTAMAAGPPRTWNLSGAQRLPTTLGGVTVSFNGLPAALYYVSDTQINALAPSGVAPGPVQVVVQSNGIAGAPFAATAAVAQPAIYGLPSPDGGTLFVTAALAGTATLVGNSAADPRVARAALPGDILDLYLIGLGATADPAKFLTDQPFAGAFEVAATVTASIGGEPAPVSFAGLITPGLYLVRVAVPSRLAPGPQPVQISAGGVKTRPALALLIGAAP